MSQIFLFPGDNRIDVVYSNERINVSRIYKGDEIRSKVAAILGAGTLSSLWFHRRGSSEVGKESRAPLSQWRNTSREILPEVATPFLQKMGMMHPDGKVKRPHFSKFVQVQQMLNFLFHVGPEGVSFAGLRQKDWLDKFRENKSSSLSDW
eukprot:CAMPEP_0184486430 /NCGR_PEP_ID=MMETSP0113_2-20130426/7929_1 /TAXON_ID=91329 /ORGANISM="Norrisiella sphaerica, Strain BC52" /LENGTH=149 /DNA_ID=CAMNT_0026868319 /DNA_START=786 /DNA_END=1232 /DNA_ORIENTATION=-